MIVSFSGGRDSTVMLALLLEKGVPFEEIVFFDWGMEFPETYRHIEKVERDLGVEVVRLKPEKSFEYWMFDHVKTKGPRQGEKGYGWAHFTRRWCTGRKLYMLRNYVGERGSYIGLRIDEPRRKRDPDKVGKDRFPLREWRMTEEDVIDICAKRGWDWDDLYDDDVRHVSCWCCPLQSLSALRRLPVRHPDLWEKLLEMDSKVGFPWPSPVLEKVKREVLGGDRG